MDTTPEPASGAKASGGAAPTRAKTGAARKPATPRKPAAPRAGTAKNGSAASTEKKASPTVQSSSAAKSSSSATSSPAKKPSSTTKKASSATKKPSSAATKSSSTAKAAAKSATPKSTAASTTAKPKAVVEPKTEPKADAAPETKAPETKVPETKAPETKSLEAKAPETKALEAKAPETKAPETKAPPEAKAPETKAPPEPSSASAETDPADETSGLAAGWARLTRKAAPTIDRAVTATRAQLSRWRRAVAADVAEVREQVVSKREVESIELVAQPASGLALSVQGLVRSFDDTIAVDGVSLDVPAGCFYGIVGPNGAGKTTLLSMISGLLRPDAGTVVVHGADVWRDPAATKRDMGVLPDRLRLFDKLTGAQLLYYSAMLRGLDRATARQRTADLASVFGIEDALGRLITDYSTGMTKKVALAAAMIHAPRLLVLDEPFESVDPVSAATVSEILRKYALAGGTVVLSSHSMDLVQRMCDRVAVIVDGGIIAEGTVEEVRGAATLQERFVELAGRKSVEELEWLHGSSN